MNCSICGRRIRRGDTFTQVRVCQLVDTEDPRPYEVMDVDNVCGCHEVNVESEGS